MSKPCRECVTLIRQQVSPVSLVITDAKLARIEVDAVPRSDDLTEQSPTRGELLAALEKYGVHLPSCHPGIPAWAAYTCTCGLDQVRGRKHLCEQCEGRGWLTGSVDPVTLKYTGDVACQCGAPPPPDRVIAAERRR